MIAVIADDFTGAAEIGGIALKYGLKVMIETEVKEVSDTDILIIATDTRSFAADEAFVEIEKITAEILKLQPEFIYKKLDSVLRGNIAVELAAQMEVTGKKRAIVVAGNPFFGRTIKNGIYKINSVPLAETNFTNDPEFPLKTSSVVQILKTAEVDVISKSVEDNLPEEGLIVGDVSNYMDMVKWIKRADKNTALAGGAGFFDILLSNKFVRNPYPGNDAIYTGKRTLIVFGSTYPKTSELIDRFCNEGVVIKNMPEEIYNNKWYDEILFENWANEVTECLHSDEKVIVSVDYSYSNEEMIGLRIKQTVARLVKRVLEDVELNDLFIEGGATTSEILRVLNISKLFPVAELEQGIIQMKVDEYENMRITTKPGSYTWPKNIIFENVN